MSYKTGMGFRALGEGLFEIGRILEAQRREKEFNRRRQEDMDRATGAQRTQDLSMPGATTFEGFLQDPGNYRNPRVPMGPSPTESEFRAASADTPIANVNAMADAAIAASPEFRPPPPREIATAAGGTMKVQERSPFMTETGVVINPRQIPTESAIGRLVAASEERRLFGPSREELERDRTRQELAQSATYYRSLYKLSDSLPDEEAVRVGKARETRDLAVEQHRQQRQFDVEHPLPSSGGEPSYTAAYSQLLRRYGKWNDKTGQIELPPQATEEWVAAAQRAIQSGQAVPPMPSTGRPTWDATAPWWMSPPAAQDRSPGWSVRGPGVGQGAPSATPMAAAGADTRSQQQRDWDALAQRFGADSTTKRVGPRPAQ